MTSALDNGDVTVIEIDPAQENAVVFEIPDSSVRVIGLPGGGSDNGGGSVNPVVDWFTGIGPPPDALIGAGPGDMYIDVESGFLYQLR